MRLLILFNTNLGPLLRPRQCENAYIFRAGGLGGLCRRRERRAGGHHVIDENETRAAQRGKVAGIGADRPVERGMARGPVETLEALGLAVPDQQVGHEGQPRLARQRPRQKRGLVEPPRQQPHPVQRHRRDDRAGGEKRRGGAGEPFARRARRVVPVAMLERQHQPPPVGLIAQRGAPSRPWPRDAQAFVAMHLCAALARKRDAAQIADQPGDEGRIAPAGTAQAEIVGHGRPAKRAARRIDKPDRHL